MHAIGQRSPPVQVLQGPVTLIGSNLRRIFYIIVTFPSRK